MSDSIERQRGGMINYARDAYAARYYMEEPGFTPSLPQDRIVIRQGFSGVCQGKHSRSRSGMTPPKRESAPEAAALTII